MSMSVTKHSTQVPNNQHKGMCTQCLLACFFGAFKPSKTPQNSSQNASIDFNRKNVCTHLTTKGAF